jgi:F0F1-type ATP synthase membrane subunit a
VAFIALHIFVSVIQAYVFTVLPAVYLGLATAEEH